MPEEGNGKGAGQQAPAEKTDEKNQNNPEKTGGEGDHKDTPDPKELLHQKEHFRTKSEKLESTVTDLQSRLSKYEQAEEDERKKKLEEKGEYEKLIGEKDSQINTLNQQIQDLKFTQEFTQRISEHNPHDIATTLAALDRSKIKFADDGSVSGLDEAVKELVETKPFLFKTDAKPTNAGGKHNPKRDAEGEDKDTTVYKLSDVTRWQQEGTWKDHREAFKKAKREGRVDMNS